MADYPDFIETTGYGTGTGLGDGTAATASHRSIRRKLLKTSIEAPQGVEVGAICDMSGNRQEQYIHGEKYSLHIPDADYEHIVLHNHPDCQVFSYADIRGIVLKESSRNKKRVGYAG